MLSDALPTYPRNSYAKYSQEKKIERKKNVLDRDSNNRYTYIQ